jgi:proteasome lid subunit RPN8/RPN11
MRVIEVYVGAERYASLEEGTLAYQALHLLLWPFVPAHLREQPHTLHILTTESITGDIGDGFRIRQLLMDGKAEVRVAGQEHEPPPDAPAAPEQQEQLLSQIVVNPQEQSSLPTPEGGRAVEPAAYGERPVVHVGIWPEALEKAYRHAGTDLHNEVGGICMGMARRTAEGRYAIEIVDTFIAEHTISMPTRLTFTPETWSSVWRIAERDYDEAAGERVVGWYHTHPGFGIFLSSYDLFIHENFFPETWHIALVIDPHARTHGFFGWGADRKVHRLPDEERHRGRYIRPRPAGDGPVDG